MRPFLDFIFSFQTMFHQPPQLFSAVVLQKRQYKIAVLFAGLRVLKAVEPPLALRRFRLQGLRCCAVNRAG